MIKNYKFWIVISVILTILMITSVLTILYDSKDNMEKLQKELIQCKIEYERYKSKLHEVKKESREKSYYENIIITAYSASIEETNNDPENTAIMESPVVGYTCAVSRDLIYLLGKKIYIHGIGVFRVNDLMNKRYDKRVDICLTKGNAITFGIKKADIVVID